MKTKEMIEKTVAKREELTSIKEDFKTVNTYQWVSFVLMILFIILMVTTIIILKKSSDAVEDYPAGDDYCGKSLNCVNDCMNYYSADSVNHSLECNYKCLRYKYCE